MTAAQEHLDPALRVEALASLLTERGLIDPATVETFIKTYEQSVGPMNGAKVVARAWADPDYRARLLAEFGLELPADTAVKVFDSSSEVRYMVLPERPAGTDGMSEEELAALVTRDAMVGAAAVSATPSCHCALARSCLLFETIRHLYDSLMPPTRNGRIS